MYSLQCAGPLFVHFFVHISFVLFSAFYSSFHPFFQQSFLPESSYIYFNTSCFTPDIYPSFHVFFAFLFLLLSFFEIFPCTTSPFFIHSLLLLFSSIFLTYPIFLLSLSHPFDTHSLFSSNQSVDQALMKNY